MGWLLKKLLSRPLLLLSPPVALAPFINSYSFSERGVQEGIDIQLANGPHLKMIKPLCMFPNLEFCMNHNQ